MSTFLPEAFSATFDFGLCLMVIVREQAYPGLSKSVKVALHYQMVLGSYQRSTAALR
jgi:hypothetical protein